MKKRVIFLAALILLMLLPPACASREEPGEDGLRLWFAVPGDSQSRDVAAALSFVPYTGTKSIPDLLSALLAGPPQDSGLVSLIPPGTGLVSWSVAGWTAHVELSGEYAQLSGIDRTIADYCVTLTLSQLSGVDRVELSDGNGSGKMLRTGDIIFSGAEEEPVDVPASLYFRRTGSASLAFELRVFRLTEDETPAWAVLEALIAGPENEGLAGLLPQDLTVRYAWVDDGVCYADLSGALLDAMPDSPEEQEMVISSIVDTLCSLDTVNQVQLLVEGEPLMAYGALELPGPLRGGQGNR